MPTFSNSASCACRGAAKAVSATAAWATELTLSRFSSLDLVFHLGAQGRGRRRLWQGRAQALVGEGGGTAVVQGWRSAAGLRRAARVGSLAAHSLSSGQKSHCWELHEQAGPRLVPRAFPAAHQTPAQPPCRPPRYHQAGATPQTTSDPGRGAGKVAHLISNFIVSGCAGWPWTDGWSEGSGRDGIKVKEGEGGTVVGPWRGGC